MAQSGKITELAADMVSRVVAGVSVVLTGSTPAWFGPMDPLTPVAPPDTAGRQFDYQTGYNQTSRPRSGELVGFAQMRALADGYDLMRLLIEGRKDQLAKMPWTIKLKDKIDTPIDESDKPDARYEVVAKFLEYPDKEHNWDTWLRMLIEDLLVLDAPTIYPRKTRGGELYALELMDGATIKRVLSDDGRTPLPPETAYQQILKGVPASNYTREELIYLPRNPRTHKVYGYSPVEQVITTVNIALRRQVHQLGYYTHGSTPDLVFSVPESWSSPQIKQFEEYWNSILSGELGERRKTRFVPHGVTPFDTKDKALKDEFDEWIARVMCYAFSVSPQPFIKEMNRATAQTGQESALSEGLAPLMTWVKSAIDLVIKFQFGFDDIEFVWKSTQAIKPKDQADIDAIYLDRAVVDPDEIRAERYGLPPMDPAKREAMKPKPKADPNQPEEDPVKNPDPEKVAKAKKPMGTINRDRAVTTEEIQTIQDELGKFLTEQAPIIAAQVVEAIETIGKATDNDGLVNRILNSISFGGWTKLTSMFTKSLTKTATDGVNEALIQIDVTEATDDMLTLANQHAIKYARDRAAELVGKRYDKDGHLVDNNNAQMTITDSTREMLRDSVTKAMEEGWSNERLTKDILDNHAFSSERAETIARTETAFADIEGNLIGYEESGLVEGKQWLTASGCCPKCAKLNNKIVKLDAYFMPGSYRKNPPLHPHCRCDVLPVFPEDMPEDLDQHNGATELSNSSELLLDANSDGLPADSLPTSGQPWGVGAAALRKSEELFDKLVQDGIEPPITWAVHHWTLDSRYISDIYRANPKLKVDLKAEFSVIAAEVNKRLDELFSKAATKIKAPVTVYRGEGLTQAKLDSIKGLLSKNLTAIEVDRSFQANTLDIDLANDFADRSKKAGYIPAIYVSTLQTGVKAVDITKYHYYHPDNEVLLNRDQQRIITGISEREDGVIIMNAIVVPKGDIKKAHRPEMPSDDAEWYEVHLDIGDNEDPRLASMLDSGGYVYAGPSLDTLKEYLK